MQHQAHGHGLLASVRHALDGSMPIALRIVQQVTLTAPMKAQYVVFISVAIIATRQLG
jgi:hypothetical protein